MKSISLGFCSDFLISKKQEKNYPAATEIVFQNPFFSLTSLTPTVLKKFFCCRMNFIAKLNFFNLDLFPQKSIINRSFNTQCLKILGFIDELINYLGII